MKGLRIFVLKNYTKISKGDNYSFHVNNMVRDDEINVCIETYKGSVDNRVPDVSAIQVINPLGPSSPAPIDTSPELWGIVVLPEYTMKRLD